MQRSGAVSAKKSLRRGGPWDGKTTTMEEGRAMSNSKLDQIMGDLAQQRDELRLKLHLAKADAKQEWEALEEKWIQLEAKLRATKQEAADASQDVGAAFGVLSDELSSAYQRIKKKLSAS
jgi:hypothetical protein